MEDPKDKEIEGLKTALKSAEQKASTQEQELTTAATMITDLKKVIAEKDALISQQIDQIAKQSGELTVAGQTVTDLKTLLEAQTAVAEKLPTLTVDKVSYELTTPEFNYKGEIVTLALLKERPKLAQELIKEGVSFLQKVK